jgi:hypothetical protein
METRRQDHTGRQRVAVVLSISEAGSAACRPIPTRFSFSPFSLATGKSVSLLLQIKKDLVSSISYTITQTNPEQN